MPSLAVRSVTAAAVLALSSSLLSSCDAGSASPFGGSADQETTSTTSPSQTASQAPAGQIRSNIQRGAGDVAVDTVVKVFARHGRLSTVTVSAASQSGTDADPSILRGTISGDGSSWRALDRLEPGTPYRVEATVRGNDGALVTRRTRFTTQELSLDQQTYPSIAPLPGETVGVGMPVIVNFDVPVTDRASIEQHLTVTSTPAQAGGWYWLNDREVHFRPKKYWKPGTKVKVDVDINSVPAGEGVYGQLSRQVDFKVGDAHIYKVDMNAHNMQVFSNGKLLRTLPVTTGEQPKFTTRSGVKVIIEKFDAKRMNSETVGIPNDSADGYNIDNVQWAMRVTYSGEFIHAAPWSVGSQGYANVSHGCTGLSTADAGWLYAMSRRGDVVKYVGTDRSIEPGNGYSEWNLSWAQFQDGSALGG
ncbi:Ig-like domain-containing protein [Nocardioides sp.]|uniref:L,D-transpeptidase n=1 Tax=Nocardioides sp. TaxID=35761 RepID=UPI0035621A7D